MAEKSLEWTDHLLDLGKKDQIAPEYLKLNPNGVVPTLVHDGTVIIDSSVICEYIDEVFPDPPLIPADPAERARMRAWMRFMEEVPTAAVRVPSFNMVFLPRFDGLDDEQFLEAEAGPRPLRKHFFEKMGRNGFADKEVAASMEQLRQTCERMDRALTRRRSVVDGRILYASGYHRGAVDRSYGGFGLCQSVVRFADGCRLV